RPDVQAAQACGQSRLHVVLLLADLADPGHYHRQPGHCRAPEMDVRANTDLPVHLADGPLTHAPALDTHEDAIPQRARRRATLLRSDRAMKFLLIAGFPDSILQFRGALLEALQANGLEVHVAAPGLAPGSPMRQALDQRGM